MVYRNDDMGAFGGKITVNFDNKDNAVITRAEFQCGCFYRDIENPVFPLEFKPTKEDTAKFSNITLAYENGLRKTCKGFLRIPVENEVITHNDRLCR